MLDKMNAGGRGGSHSTVDYNRRRYPNDRQSDPFLMKRVTTPLKRPDAGSSSACTYLPPLAMDRAYSEWGKI